MSTQIRPGRFDRKTRNDGNIGSNKNISKALRNKKHNQQFETTRRNKTALDSTKLAIFHHFQLFELAL